MKAERAPAQSTEDRILAAALQEFSANGLGATTRSIARTAGVNEVTLFRHFETKDKLLAAVTRETCRWQSEALDAIGRMDFDLRRDLTEIAEAYDRSTTKHMGFIRTMIGQPVDPILSEQIIREVAEPLRAKFLDYLEEAQRRGMVRKADFGPVVDCFTGMIFSGALKRHMRRPRYSREAYLAACVDLFVQGIQKA